MRDGSPFSAVSACRGEPQRVVALPRWNALRQRDSHVLLLLQSRRRLISYLVACNAAALIQRETVSTPKPRLAALFAILLAILTSSAGMAQPAAVAQQAAGAQQAASAWSNFEWAAATIGAKKFDRAALLVPITLQDVRGQYYLQLDAGSDTSGFYEVPYNQVMKNVGRTQAIPGRATWTGSLGKYRVTNLPIEVKRKFGDPVDPNDEHPVIGTLGLDFFSRRVLVLDFPGRRFAVRDAEQAQFEVEKQAVFVPARYRDGKLFIPVTLGGKLFEDSFFFDTGTSALPMTMSQRLWKELTGKSGAEPDNIVLEVNSWDVKVKLIGSRLRGSVAIGPVTLDNPEAYFNQSDPQEFENWPYKVSGLIGNAAFYDSFAVIIDSPRNRFGIVRARGTR